MHNIQLFLSLLFFLNMFEMNKRWSVMCGKYVAFYVYKI